MSLDKKIDQDFLDKMLGKLPDPEKYVPREQKRSSVKTPLPASRVVKVIDSKLATRPERVVAQPSMDVFENLPVFLKACVDDEILLTIIAMPAETRSGATMKVRGKEVNAFNHMTLECPGCLSRYQLLQNRYLHNKSSY